MSLDRQTKVSSYKLDDSTYAVPGFRSASIESWTYVGVAPNGGSVIQCDEQIAITKILQGSLLFDYYTTFGGIDANGDIAPSEYGVTTTMPNANAPIIDTVYCNGVGIWKVRQVINSNTIVIEDPASLATTLSASLMYGLRSVFSPPTQLQFSGIGTIGMYCIDGTSVGASITLPHEVSALDGSTLQPVMYTSLGDTFITITY